MFRIFLILAFLIMILPAFTNKNRKVSFDEWKQNRENIKQRILKTHGLNE